MPDACVPHPAVTAPSPWVARFAGLIAPHGQVLDLAAGHGRHARHLAQMRHAVHAVDRDPAALASLRAIDGVTAVDADLEAGAWPFAGRRFDGIVVTHYLWRPLFPHLVAALAEGGVLIYETFGIGNESFGKPSNPQFLLRTGELLEVARGAGLATVAFETGFTVLPKPAVIERICARAPGAGSTPANLDGPGAGPGA